MEKQRILFSISQLRWAYRSEPKISDMDDNWILNSLRMIREGRAKVCDYPELAHIYICLFEKEINKRKA